MDLDLIATGKTMSRERALKVAIAEFCKFPVHFETDLDEAEIIASFKQVFMGATPLDIDWVVEYLHENRTVENLYDTRTARRKMAGWSHAGKDRVRGIRFFSAKMGRLRYARTKIDAFQKAALNWDGDPWYPLFEFTPINMKNTYTFSVGKLGGRMQTCCLQFNKPYVTPIVCLLRRTGRGYEAYDQEPYDSVV